MTKLQLLNVTLLGIDCVNVERLQLALDVSQKDIEFGDVKLLTSLETNDERKIKIPHIGSEEEYSKFCLFELNKHIDTDFVLIVQYDGFVLSADRWNPEFLQYDYIGAPCSWLNQKLTDPNDRQSGYIVGNGGFSLRSKKFIEYSTKLSSIGSNQEVHPEDVSLCVYNREFFKEKGFTYAPVELAKTFSVQENYGEYVQPFGFHGLYKENLKTILREHPDFDTTYLMQKMVGRKEEQVHKTFKNFNIETKKNNEGNSISALIHSDKRINNIEELVHDVGSVVHIENGNDVYTVIYSTHIGNYTVVYKTTSPD